jgi:hypothetical protein
MQQMKVMLNLPLMKFILLILIPMQAQDNLMKTIMWSIVIVRFLGVSKPVEQKSYILITLLPIFGVFQGLHLIFLPFGMAITQILTALDMEDLTDPFTITLTTVLVAFGGMILFIHLLVITEAFIILMGLVSALDIMVGIEIIGRIAIIAGIVLIITIGMTTSKETVEIIKAPLLE